MRYGLRSFVAKGASQDDNVLMMVDYLSVQSEYSRTKSLTAEVSESRIGDGDGD